MNLLFKAISVGAVCLVLNSVAPRAEAKIEAIPGKTYALTKVHGPWIIMVTSLWGETPEKYANAVKAADELVLELRKKGIPAYTYIKSTDDDAVNTVDRMGRHQRRVYNTQVDMIGVVAGNYESADDPIAQKTLKYVKRFQPKVLQVPGAPNNGQGPLSKAFLTLNPMLNSAEIVAHKAHDPLLRKLNSGAAHSLLANKGKYSLIVASFYGKSMTKPRSFGEFDSKLQEKSLLNDAAVDSWELVETMRNQGMEAYIYHDRFRSIVTVGSFDSADDPRARDLYEKFRAKVKKNPETGEEIQVGESIQIASGSNLPPIRSWTMDPYPELIQVPKWK